MKTEKGETVIMTAEEKAARESYRRMINEEILKAIPLLRELSEKLNGVKRKVFGDFQTIFDIRSEFLSQVRDSQRCLSFTDEEGKYRLTLKTDKERFIESVHIEERDEAGGWTVLWLNERIEVEWKRPPQKKSRQRRYT